jgi:hypothetical protein
VEAAALFTSTACDRFAVICGTAFACACAISGAPALLTETGFTVALLAGALLTEALLTDALLTEDDACTAGFVTAETATALAAEWLCAAEALAGLLVAGFAEITSGFFATDLDGFVALALAALTEIVGLAFCAEAL